MLADDDAALVERDSRLPGLALLLDSEALAAALRGAAPEADIADVEAFYLRYKPGTNCLCCYRLRIGRESTIVYAKAFAPDDPGLHKVHHPVVEGATDPGTPATLLLGEHSVRVWTFPSDQRVRALSRLGDRERRRRLLKRILPEKPDWWDAEVTPLAYKPDRRFVGRLDVDGRPVAILRLYTRTGFARAVGRARFVAAAPEGELPALHGVSERHGAIVYGWTEGRSLLDDLRDDAFQADRFEAAGAALARLHRFPPRELPQQEAEGVASALRSAAREIGGLLPDLAARASSLADALAVELAATATASATLHGDFHPKQVVASAGRVGLIDLDAACSGDPCRDLGEFLAHLERYRLAGTIAEGLSGPAGGALLGGYQRERGAEDPTRIHLQTAASLLRLASYPFRRREESWRRGMTAIVEAAERIFRDVRGLATA